MSKALLIFSGGQDSTTCLFWARARYDEVFTLTFDYQQRHHREIDSARQIAALAGVGNEVLNIGAIFAGLSPLTNSKEAVACYQSPADLPGGLEKTFVPGRNILFLSLAANRAYVLGCDDVIIGVSEEDFGGYPDCRLDFIHKMESALQSGLDRELKLVTPLIALSKGKTVELAMSMPGCMEALSLSTTCYNGTMPPCRTCHSCLLREKGFMQAGVDDPLLAKGVSMRGKNPARPQELSDGERTIWVQSVFYTLQGEGPFTGHPAIFIRLGGCNLKCYWCDTDFESSVWKPSLPELMERVDSLRTPGCKLAVITGGEPFRQNIAPLVVQLLERQLKVQIETNGTLWVDIPDDEDVHIVCSPKTATIHKTIRQRVFAYKYVIAASETDPDDGLPVYSTQQAGANCRVARPDKTGCVYVMPQDSFEPEQNYKNQQAAAQVALRFGYNLTLQTHKIIGLE